MKIPAKVQQGSGAEIWRKFNQLIDFCRSITPVAGPGLRLTQTTGGSSLSLAKHAASHAGDGIDPITFDELTLTKKIDDEDVTITLDPDDLAGQANQVFAVKSDESGTNWRTLFALLKTESGFAADKSLKVNEDGDGLEWGEGGGTVESSGGTGVSLVTSDGKVKTIYGV